MEEKIVCIRFTKCFISGILNSHVNQYFTSFIQLMFTEILVLKLFSRNINVKGVISMLNYFISKKVRTYTCALRTQ